MAVLDNLIDGWDTDPEDDDRPAWLPPVVPARVGRTPQEVYTPLAPNERPNRGFVPSEPRFTHPSRRQPDRLDEPAGISFAAYPRARFIEPEPEPDDSWRAEVFGTAEQRDKALGR